MGKFLWTLKYGSIIGCLNYKYAVDLKIYIAKFFILQITLLIQRTSKRLKRPFNKLHVGEIGDANLKRVHYKVVIKING